MFGNRRFGPMLAAWRWRCPRVRRRHPALRADDKRIRLRHRQGRQGGVLPGVSAVLVNQAQGTEQTVMTTRTGRFLFPYVQPGTYTPEADARGIPNVRTDRRARDANDRLMAGAFTLTIGQLSESITVAGQSNDIQLRSGERAFTLQSVAMQNIAVNGRSFFGLAVLVRASSGTARRPRSATCK